MLLRTDLKKSRVWVNQAAWAQEMGCSVATLKRALRELISHGLIKVTKTLQWGKYKTYEIVREIKEKVQKILAPSVKNEPEGSSKMSYEVAQKCTPINRIEKQNKEQQLSPIAESMLQVGLKQKVVVDLIKNFEEEVCAKQLKHLELLKKKPENEVAWLISAIKEDFQLPNGVKTAEEQKIESQEEIEKEEKRAGHVAEAKKMLTEKRPQEALMALRAAEQTKPSQESALLILKAKEDLEALERHSEAQKLESLVPEEKRRSLWQLAERKIKQFAGGFFQESMREELITPKYQELLKQEVAAGGR